MIKLIDLSIDWDSGIIDDLRRKGYACKIFSEVFLEDIILASSEEQFEQLNKSFNEVIYSPEEMWTIRNYTKEQLKLTHMNKRILRSKIIR